MNDAPADAKVPSVPVKPAEAPSLEALRACADDIAPYIVRTPVHRLETPEVHLRLPGHTLWLKLELLQRTGSFKARGAIAEMRALDAAARARGVVAVSAGNHAMAVAYAAQVVESHAKVVMPRNANPGRVRGAKALGAEVILVDDVHAAFAEVRRIEADEGRTFIHPFEGPGIARGVGSLGLEIVEQIPDLTRVVLPIGGGGLAGGVAAAVKQAKPEVEVIGVEPFGADSMWRSRAAGRPEGIDKVRTIADSLGAPHAEPYSFALCERYIDELLRVEDRDLVDAMRFLAAEAKLAVEPAGAATTAALLGPLADRPSRGATLALVCGANIDPKSFAEYLLEGAE